VSNKPKLPDGEKLQYALDNFAGVLKNVEYLAGNFNELKKILPPEILELATTGYFVSLGALIRNNQGMDYTKIFELLEKAMDSNKEYPEQNEALRYNIDVLREWKETLAYEMTHILTLRDQYFAHIDFVDKNFLTNAEKNKDRTKQDDLVKFFRCLLDVCQDYSLSVIKVYEEQKN